MTPDLRRRPPSLRRSLMFVPRGDARAQSAAQACGAVVVADLEEFTANWIDAPRANNARRPLAHHEALAGFPGGDA